jgi:hypothetical protein
MTRALIYKEFREAMPVAAIGLAAMLLVALDAMDLNPVPNLFGYRQQGTIPFISYGDEFVSRYAMAGGLTALALGLWQSLGDFRGDAHLFVLHRPASRRRLYGVKMLVGLTAFLICAFLPILLYALWASTPGTHASPFDWSMTRSAWITWLSLATLYLGAFLSGIRPAAWMGTRLAPLAATACILLIPSLVMQFNATAGLLLMPPLLLVVDAVLAASIFHVVEARDFA